MKNNESIVIFFLYSFLNNANLFLIAKKQLYNKHLNICFLRMINDSLYFTFVVPFQLYNPW